MRANTVSAPAQIRAPEHPVPYQALSQVLKLSNEDEARWWHSTACLFSRLLISSNYDEHIQYKFLALYREHVLPALGPYVTKHPGSPEFIATRWRSGMTLPGLPIEFSNNVSQAVIRVGVDPVGPLAGTASDPYNLRATLEYLEPLSQAGLGIDLTRFHQFAEHLVTTQDEVGALVDDPALFTSKWKSQTITAMDLKKSGAILMKAYFYPQVKAAVTGIPAEKLLLDAISAVDHRPTVTTQLKHITSYTESRRSRPLGCPECQGESSLFPYFLACDLVDPASSRIKYYVAEQHCDLAVMEDVWTFGGRRNDPDTVAGLALLRQFWRLIPKIEGHCPFPSDFCEVGKPAHGYRCLSMLHFNLDGQTEFPEPQMYICTFGQNDRAILEGLTKFFELVGWADMAQHYAPNFLANQ
jgi:DMATS type aromatic prenyltransferase